VSEGENAVAVASVVMGGISILTACVCCYGFPFNVLGIGLGVGSFVMVARLFVFSLVFGLGFGMLGALADQM